MSTWLSKMNNGGMSGGMKREPIVPGLNTSAAKVSKTKAAVNTEKIASDGDKADKEAETNDNNSFANKLKKKQENEIKQKQIAKEGQDDLDKANAAQVADTSYINQAAPSPKPSEPTKPKASGGKIAPMIASAVISAISSKKK
jgi:hypothetical protein